MCNNTDLDQGKVTYFIAKKIFEVDSSWFDLD